MALRFQLINEIVGSLVIDKDDPIDINALSQMFKRSETYSGIMYEITFDVSFIKGSRAYLNACYEQAGGIDAIVVVNLYELDPNIRRWKLYGTGQVDFNRREVDEITVVVNIEQTGVERRVLNMMEIDVDIETEESENGTALPPQSVYNILHHSKTILKEYNTTPDDEGEFQQLDIATITLVNVPPPLDPDVTVGFVSYLQIDNSNILADELTQNFTTPYTAFTYDNPLAQDQIGGVGNLAKYTAFLSDPSRLDSRNPQHEADEVGTLDIEVNYRLKFKVSTSHSGGDIDICGSGVLGNVEVFAWCEKRDKDDNIIFIDQVGQWNMAGCGGSEREGIFETKNYTRLAEPMAIGDKIYVYPTLRVYGTYESPHVFPSGPSGVIVHDLLITVDDLHTYISFKSLTVSEPSEVKGVLIYEAVQRCVQYYTNQVDCFKSDLLGRTDLGYAADGKGSLITIENGYWLRGMSGLNSLGPVPRRIGIWQLFTNLKYLLDFINSVYCIGFGFEYANGKQIFRVEPIEFFFNKNSKILSLGKVYKPRKKINPKGFYNMIEYGYTTKITAKQVNGIDEFNTLRRAIIPVINTKNKLEVASDMITAGHLIENQRRLRLKSEDSEFDNRVFAVVVIRDGGGFKSKKDEGYSLISNYISPDTGYNYDIAPAECLKNWLKIIASSLIRSTRKVVRFNYGEVNYRLQRTKTGEIAVIAEDGNFDVTFIEPIWDNEYYIIDKIKFTRDQVQLIKANPYGYIEFFDKFGNKFEGFISSNGIEHDSTNKSAALNLLRVFRPNQ